ncbi:PDR/VanB family oxidoreductase [Cupriavidus metallidurans]|uniref:PDR/VanB family oxidoreductase n=1 Tax=Cupriavidus metallidurans TaxID=119219 RepID=UPI001CCBB53A|nr:PDR/VanB family oxidoreductase [Cupriavidus metallidurans]UBM09380.1 PDR/VanB family oxidoreductase [Cupriavidus metallidurans]
MLNVRVERKRQVADEICSFHLVSATGEPLPSFTAGSHVDVHLPGGLVRQYSLCGDPGDAGQYILGVLKDPASRGGSIAMHSIEEGSEIQISAPRNHFPIEDGAGHSILLAGGIGVTPLMAMARALSSERRSFELHYCTRNLARTAFKEELLQGAMSDRVHLHLDEGRGERFDAEAVLRGRFRPDAHIYICGPAGFIEAMISAAKEAGFAESQVHREYFAAPKVAPSELGDGVFQVQIKSTGAIHQILPEETVVQVLGRHGIEIETSCEQGVCGTCVTRVLEGVPDHRDVYLTDQEHVENKLFTPCCSRACSPMLVLDL